ncbi:glycosyltransferase family 4 protein [Arachidicoccus sp.]|uniref:glycosyltransferase family 4 protein n=1 Tax=Arachidicoccus sp. TaxID=1872624 RepID=UPI003D1AC9A2
MKIAHIIFSLNMGSIENELVDIINYQSHANHLIALFIINSKTDQDLMDQINKDVHIVQIKRNEGSRHIFPIIKLNYLLNKWDAQVIHCHNQNIIGTLFSRHLKRKALITVYDGIADQSINRYKKLFTVSHSLEKMALKKLVYQPKIIYGGVNLAAIPFKRNHRRESNRPFRILQINSLYQNEYGQHLLIEALACLHNKGIKNIWIDFIGDGESQQNLEALTSNYQLENYITFLRNKSRTYICQKLKDYDVLVHPGQDEGFTLTIFEAMAAKVPVLISNTSTSMEIINQGELGFFFTSNNYFSLANTIEHIKSMKGPDLEEMAEHAYQYVKQNHNIQTLTESYLQHYTA